MLLGMKQIAIFMQLMLVPCVNHHEEKRFVKPGKIIHKYQFYRRSQ